MDWKIYSAPNKAFEDVSEAGSFAVSSVFAVMPMIKFYSPALDCQFLCFHLNCIKMGIEVASDFGLDLNADVSGCIY